MSKQPQTKLSLLAQTHSATLDELDKYKLLVESVEDYAIFLLDENGYILTWNKGAQKNKGWSAEEIIGQHFSIFYLPEDTDARKPERELMLAERLGRVEDEDWRVRKDGSKFWANVVITALKNDEGNLVGFAKVTRDLTERKHNEDALRSNNALLKRQQQELEAQNISKDEFISLASHQLRTPATIVKQTLGLLIQGFLGAVDPKHLAIITRAYEANERQIRTVESLLRVAQMDGGKVILHKSPMVLRDFLTEIVDEHGTLIVRKGQTIKLNLRGTLPKSLTVDAEYFRMALGNLIDNASKYSYEGSAITVTASSSKGMVVITVSDTGIGVSQQDYPLLFKKFSRIPNELSNKVGGSGLGLYWVKRVIQMHDGNITVASELHKGTTFTIEIPREEKDA